MLETITRMSTPARTKPRSGLPKGLVLFAWYLAIKVLIVSHPPALAPLISKAWWEILASRGLVILFMAALIPPLLKREGLTAADLGYKSHWPARDLAWGLGAGAVIWFIHDRLLDWAAVYAGPGLANAGQQSKVDFLQQAGPAEEFGAWLGAAVMTPIIEEVVYRAGLITSFRARWGGGARRDAAYILAGAVLFALAHELSNPLYSLVYAVTGASLAFVYVRTGTLNAAIAAHAAINAIFCYKTFH